MPWPHPEGVVKETSWGVVHQLPDLHLETQVWTVVTVAAQIYEGIPVAFVWDDVVGATSYVLQIGSATTLSDVYDANVGDVLTETVNLLPGTYYSRVVPQGAGSTTPEQTVTV